METFLFWVLLWFNVGIAAQIVMSIVDGLLNRRWPFHWNDARHFLLAGVFGFLSAFNAIMFMVQFAINPEAFMVDEEDEEGHEKPDEDVMYIVGLTDDEQKKVEAYIHTLIEARPKGEENAQ